MRCRKPNEYFTYQQPANNLHSAARIVLYDGITPKHKALGAGIQPSLLWGWDQAAGAVHPEGVPSFSELNNVSEGLLPSGS